MKEGSRPPWRNVTGEIRTLSPAKGMRSRSAKKRGLAATLERKKRLSEQKALEQDLYFFGKLADALHEPAILAGGLCHKVIPVRLGAARSAAALAESGADISGILPQLCAGLSDRESAIRAHCAWAIGKAAANRTRISKAIPSLGNALLGDRIALVRQAAAFALLSAGENGADLHPVREQLLAASNDSDQTVKWFASRALYCLRP